VKFIQNYLFLISIITFLLGGFLVAAPALAISIFFNDQTVYTQFFVRITGSTLVGYSALNNLASRSDLKEIIKIAVYGNLSTLLVATVITLFYFARFDSFGWLIVGQHLFFAFGFLICLHKLKSV